MELKIGDCVCIRSGGWCDGRVGVVKRLDTVLLGPCRNVTIATPLGDVGACEYELRRATDVEILEYKLRGG